MIEVRPQPIGIFPFPASNLLLPPTEKDHAEVLPLLMKGDLTVELPDEWHFLKIAAKGEIDWAIRLLAGSDNDVSKYNRFMLAPSAQAYENLASELSGHLRELLDVAAFATGIIDTIADSFSLEGELLAMALATSAAANIEAEKTSEALTKLQNAVAACKSNSPILAATLTSQIADLKLQTSENAAALVIQDYKEAIRLAADCELPMLLPELHIKMGMIFQNVANGQRGALLQAVNAYQFALQNGVTQEEHPELFAQLQNNLGLAYLSMPVTGSSHQLRTGIAVQSFRHALKVYTIEQDPDMWASVSMNLANALQYAPSSHPEENLIQAVETYEEVLQVRSRAKDPVAYSLVLMNQANALAHLGMFKPALEKLAEAHKLFHWYDHIEQAEAARDLVEQINQRMGDQGEPLELNTN